MDLKCWTPLTYVNDSILETVRLAYVFGTLGREALLITDDDEVLACGSNRSGCLGLGTGYLMFVQKPRSVVELQRKGVKGFSFGGASSTSVFVMAYTNSGCIYGWGKQIGVSNPSIISKPELIPLPAKISEVACGSNHVVALSADGQLYSWGSNESGQLGHGNLTKCEKPVLIDRLKEKRATKISCGSNFSVIALDSGQVFAFGSNAHCQLGSNNKLLSSSSVPVEVNLNSVIVEDITCGMYHVLALSNIGEVFAWGKNDRCELGFGDAHLRANPEKNKTIGKVIEIAATFICSISAVKTETDQIFMWGDFTDFPCGVPLHTPFKSLHEVFANFSTPRAMHKPLVRQPQVESLNVTLKKAFNNKETSDLIIRAEGKDIYVHKFILRLRTDYFRVFLQDHWVNSNQKVLELTQKYNVIYSYLQYLYTGELNGDPKLILELLNLADEYQDSTFKKQCEESFHRSITINNVANLFSYALKSNLMSVLESCISFASKRVSEVLRTPAVSEWDADTMKEFVMQCEKRKLFRS